MTVLMRRLLRSGSFVASRFAALGLALLEQCAMPEVYS